MQTKNKKKFYYLEKSLMAAALVAVFVLLWQKSWAQNDTPSITDLAAQQSSAQQTENQAKLDELNRRAQLYREIIEIKQKQQSTLSDQLSSVDVQIQEVQTQIEESKRKIDQLDGQIKNIESQIEENEKTLALQRKILVGLVEAYYQASQQNVFNLVLTDSTLTSFVSRKNDLAQTSERIKEMVDDVQALRKNLIEERTTLSSKRLEVVNAHYDLKDKNSSLEDVQLQKQQLLQQTKGEESRYQQLLARVEEQKQELLDIDSLFAASGLSVDDFPKPDSKYAASTSWFYYQWDTQWADITIGATNSSMKKWGCAVSAMAMVLTKNGTSITPKELAKKPIFSSDLINWNDSWLSSRITLTSGIAHGNVDWGTIDNEIKKGSPVIVYIKRSAGGGHYVVIHNKDKDGKYVVHDPYFGPNIFLDTSRALVGAMGTKSSTSVDQMIIYN